MVTNVSLPLVFVYALVVKTILLCDSMFIRIEIASYDMLFIGKSIDSSELRNMWVKILIENSFLSKKYIIRCAHAAVVH